MRELPIIFNGDMVRAIIDGKKTQTRRPVKPQPNNVQNRPDGTWECRNNVWFPLIKFDCGERYYCGSPFGAPGDRLWVREAFSFYDAKNTDVQYRADVPDYKPGGWRPSIHMPRWASRITLSVKRVWVERLMDISREDCIKEGFDENSEPNNYGSGAIERDAFFKTWDSIYGKTFPVKSNPWVWCCEFERIDE